MGSAASCDLREWSLNEVKGLFLYYKDECFDFGLDRETFDQLLQNFKAGLADKTWKVFDPTNSGLVNALECLGALVVSSQGALAAKVDLLFSLFDLSETGVITYDEMVILVTSVLAGTAKISGKGSLPEDEAMERLVDQAFIDADKDLSSTFTLSDFRGWLNKTFDLECESLSATDVLTRFDLLEEPNLLPDVFVDHGYADDREIERGLRAGSGAGGVESGESAILELVSRCASLRAPLEFAEPAGPGGVGSQLAASLTLRRTFGYASRCLRNNVVYVKSGEAAYPLARLVVLAGRESEGANANARASGENSRSNDVAQRWYRGHRGEVSCLACHPDGELVASGETGRRPGIHLWHSETLQTVAVLQGLHRRGIGCLAFSPSGKRLASVGEGADNALLVVYELEDTEVPRVAKLAVCVHAQVIDMCWYNGEASLVTVGTGGLTLWGGVQAPGKALTCTQGDWGRKAIKQVLTCVSTLSQQLITGTVGGQLYTWTVSEGGPSSSSAAPPVVSCLGGPTLHEGVVTCLWSTSEAPDMLLSGGSDGVVKVLDKRLNTATEYKVPSHLSALPGVHALASVRNRSRVVVGTRGGEVVEMGVDGRSLLLGTGHCGGTAVALAAHPSKDREQVVASGGDDGTVRLLDVDSRHGLLKTRRFDATVIRALCFSPDGSTLAVGTGGRCDGRDTDETPTGALHLLHGETLEPLVSVSDVPDGALTCLAYTTDGCVLGVGCASGRVHLYDVAGDFASRKCSVSAPLPAAPVASLLFSLDGQYLRVCHVAAEGCTFVDVGSGGAMSTEEVRPSDVAWVTPPEAMKLRAVVENGVLHVVVGGDEDMAADGAPQYAVHAEGGHVTAVFSPSQRMLYTLGGRDCGLLAWDVHARDLEKDYAPSKLKHANASGNNKAATDEDDDEEEDDEEGGFFAMADERTEGPAAALAVLARGGMDHLLQPPPPGSSAATDAAPWRACVFAPARAPPTSPEAPMQDLQPEWVHGFANGREVRNGLRMGPQGRLVYSAGRLVVGYDADRHEQRIFTPPFSRDAACLALSHDGALLATGHKHDGHVGIWDAEAGRLRGSVDTGLGEGVVHLTFGEGPIAACVGVAASRAPIEGLVAFHLVVMDLRAQVELARAEIGAQEPHDLAWVGPQMLVAVGHGFVTFWKLLRSEGTLERCPGVFGRKGAILPVHCVTAVNGLAATGQRDGSLYLWGEDRKVREAAEKRHEGAVDCVAARDRVIYSAGRDGYVKGAGIEQLEEVFSVYLDGPIVNLLAGACGGETLLAATQTGQIMRVPLKQPPAPRAADKDKGPALCEHVVVVQGHGQVGQTWGLATHPKTADFATCGDDGVLRLWDAKGRRPLRHKVVGACMRCVDFSPDGTLVAVGCGLPEVEVEETDGAFIVYDVATLNEVYRGRTTQTGYASVLRFCGDGSLLAVGCSESSIFLYDAQDNYLERGVCKAGGGGITHLDFTDDGKYFQVCTSRRELFYFSSTTCKRLKTGTAQLKDAGWQTFTAVFGWPVTALQQGLSPSFHVTALDRSRDATSLVAAVDSAGGLRLAAYPAVEPDAAFNVYHAHAPLATCCRWLIKDSHLLTLGGADRAVVQWRLLPPPPSGRAALSSSDVDRELVPIARTPLDCKLLRDLPLSELERSQAADAAKAQADKAGEERDKEGEKEKQKDKDKEKDAANKAKKPASGPPASSAVASAVSGGVDFAEPLPKPSVAKGLPETDELILDYVHGLRLDGCRTGLAYLPGSGEAVFLAATLVVVEDLERRVQRHYRAHTDEVISLAVHPDGRTLASGQVGQVPEVHVWDSRSLATLAVLSGLHRVGVGLLAFAPCGRRLVTAGQDEWNTLACYDWQGASGAAERLPPRSKATTTTHGGVGEMGPEEQRLQAWVERRQDFSEQDPTTAEAFGHAGLLGVCRSTKARLLDLALSPDGQWLCAVGLDYVRFWDDGGRCTSNGRPPRFGDQGQVQAFVCARYVGEDTHTCLIGCGSGEVYLWRQTSLFKVIRAHKGPVNCLAVAGGEDGMLVTGGKDGKVVLWNQKDWASLGALSLAEWRDLNSSQADSNQADGENNGQAGGQLALVGVREEEDGDVVRCLAATGVEGRLLIATRRGEVVEWDPKSNDVTVRRETHSRGGLWALATHPQRFEYATGGDDCVVRLWDGGARRLLRSRRLESSTRALAYSPDGTRLVAGYGGGGSKAEEVGSFVVLDADSLGVVYKEVQSPCGDAVTDLKFSPDGALLIAASADGSVHVYEANSGYNRRFVCSGHSCAVTQLDVSDDGRYVQSAANHGAELCYFNVRNGKQIKNRAQELRDVKWATWTLPIGWPVQGLADALGPCSAVTAVDRSKDTRLGVSLDRQGRLRLSFLPFLDARESFAYVHVGHATQAGGRCRWTSKDSHVVTVGGPDRVVMQWRHIKSRIPPNLAAKPEAREANDDVDLEWPLRSHRQECVNEGLSFEEDLISGNVDESSFVSVKPWVTMATPPSAMASTGRSGASTQTVEPPPPPEATLQLAWVHGYDAARLRNMVFYNADGHLVYCVGAVGVVYDPGSHTQRHFVSHTDDVISLAVSGDGRYVATGQLGKSPRVYVWDSRTVREVALLRGRLERGVACLAFSQGGNWLAAVGLDADHTVAVYDWRSATCLAVGAVGRAKPLCIAFSNDDRVLAIGTDCDMTFHQLSPPGAQGVVRHLRRRRGVWGKRYRYQPLLCCTYLRNGDCVTGTLDGCLYFWDERCHIKAMVAAHSPGPVYGLAPLGAHLVSGGGDGRLTLWRPGSFKKVGLADFAGVRVKSLRAGPSRSLAVATQDGRIYELSGPALESVSRPPRLLVSGHGVGPIQCLATHPTRPQYATGGLDGVLLLWDAAGRRLVKASKPMEGPIGALAFSHDGALLAVGLGAPPLANETEAECNGSLLVLNALTLEVVCRDRRADGWVRCLRFSSDSTLLAMGSNDRHVYLYETSAGAFRRSYNHRATCRGHTKGVTHVDFSEDGRHLRSASCASELLYWGTASGSALPYGANELRDTSWASWTSPYGWHVKGLWPEAPDGIEVLSVDRSPDRTLLAASDDHGRLRLYRFPCFQPEAQFHLYGGHSPLITNCRWTAAADATPLLITTGGTEKGVFQWALRLPSTPPATAQQDPVAVALSPEAAQTRGPQAATVRLGATQGMS